MEMIPVLSNEQFLSQALVLLGGLKGASALGVTAVVVQLVMKFLATPWADSLPAKQGQYKLIVFLGCTLVSGILAQLAAGMELLPALFSSSTLAAVMVFANQLYKQFLVKEN